MTPQQLQEWSDAMGFTKQIQAAWCLHRSVSTYSAYLNGHRPIPDHVEELCRFKLQARLNNHNSVGNK